MGKKEAKDKVRTELSAFRDAMAKLSGSACYQRAPEIMFTEAAADRLQHLCDDEELAALVEAGGTLEGCVRSIVDYCRKDIGRSGEISEDEFRACIKDYYRMPERAGEPRKPSAKKAPEVPATTPKPEKPKRDGPSMLSTQLDMFGLLQPAEKPESEKEDTDE